jgi:hypothetical protein
VTDPFVIPELTERADAAAEVDSLRRQLQREQEARRLAEQLAGQGIEGVLREQREVMLLGRVAIAANEAPSLTGAVGECLSLVARHAGWPAATMWIRQPDDPHLHPTGVWFNEPGTPCPELVEAVSSRLTVPSGSLPGQVAASGAPQWFDDLQYQANWLRGERDDELAVATAFAVPVWAGRDVVGVVALFHEQKIERDGRLLELIEQVVTQLGVAVRRFTDVGDHELLASSATLSFTAERDEYGACPSERAAGELGEVAHQVRTPLHGLIGNLELLCESGLDEDQRDVAALALQSAIDLHRRLEGWLDKVDTTDPAD